MTKYSRLLRDPDEMEAVFREAHFHALDGRMGPVWIDLPVNLQWETLDVGTPCRLALPTTARIAASGAVADFPRLLDLVRYAKRPVIIAGNGIRAAGCQEELLYFTKNCGVPFVSTWTAADLTATNDPLFGGIIGVCGQRGANKILYHADLIICLGSHLAVTQSGTLFKEFAPDAKKVIIDIDKGELDNLNVDFDLKIHSDLRDFFEFYRTHPCNIQVQPVWIKEFSALKELNSVVATLTAKSSIGNDQHVNSNYFNFKLTEKIPVDSHIVVDGGGTALYTGFQSTFLKRGQRIICSSSISAMGTGLPESIGVCFGLARSTVYCLIGDGSLMLNIQELQTIFHHKLPVKVIVYNNKGYLAIRHTQKSFLGGRYFGTDSELGVSVPSIKRIADCFEIDYLEIGNVGQVDTLIDAIVSHPGPLIVEVNVPDDQSMLFQQGYRRISPERFQPVTLSEMAPYVDAAS
ncbi:MAG: thiamine pyrophosphate-binding protein [Methylophilaceae bacterium]|nr:MAG: thiamine pyrophosphate-binding protein [Methylophilaceae bacterium]